MSESKATAPKGTALHLAGSISEALTMLDQGRVEAARTELENALRLADATNRHVSRHVGLSAVRSGNAFKKVAA